MAGSYEVWLTDSSGRRLANRYGETLLDNIKWMTLAKHSGRISYMQLGLPATFDVALIQPDRMIQVFRAPEGGQLSLWHTYFIRKWRYETFGKADKITLYGPDPMDLLRRRIVAYYAGESESSKSDYADDMMKEIVTEAMSDSGIPTPAAGTRAWPNLSVAGDLGDGPSIEMGFAWKPLLTRGGGGVLPDISKAAKEAGTEVFYDIVPNVVTSTSITYQFRTYTGQPGADLTDSVVFDQAKGNLKDPYLLYDYYDEANYVYAGGQGEKDERNVQQVHSAKRYNQSIWGRCEAFADARNSSTNNEVREAGRVVLRNGLPKRRFGGIPLDTEGLRYGIDWNMGDKVRARYRDIEFDAIIRAVVLSVDGKGKETIQARIEYED